MEDSDIVTVWDGIEFDQMTRKRADKLVKADKLEIVEGQELKYRHEFTGFHKKPEKNSFKDKTVEK